MPGLLTVQTETSLFSLGYWRSFFGRLCGWRKWWRTGWRSHSRFFGWGFLHTCVRARSRHGLHPSVLGCWGSARGCGRFALGGHWGTRSLGFGEVNGYVFTAFGVIKGSFSCRKQNEMKWWKATDQNKQINRMLLNCKKQEVQHVARYCNIHL